MLRAVHIKEFGLFRDRTFVLGPVTVFSGANQSGKSTLFDAVRIHAFHPDKRGKDNRALYARYGEGSDVRLDWSDTAPEMDDPTFMNLFAVGGGQVEVDLSGDWLTGVKKRLFAGGIDPQALIVHFERTASDKGSYTHMRARADHGRRRNEVEGRLAELEARRAEVLHQMTSQATRRDTLKGLQAGLIQLRGREGELAGEVALEERKVERARLEAVVALLETVAGLEQAQQGRQAFAVDRSGELGALEHAAREADAVRIRAEQARQGEGTALESLRGALERAAHEVSIRSGWREGAETVEQRIARYRDLKLSKRMIRGVAAVLLALSGVAAGVLSGWAGWGIGVLLAGLGVAPAVFLLPELWEQRRLLSELKDRWRAAAGGSSTLEPGSQIGDSRTLEGVVAALARVMAEVARYEAEHAAKTDAERVGTDRLAERERELAEAVAGGAAAEAGRQEWLAALGVASRDAYMAALGTFREVHDRLSEGYKRLEAAMRERGVSDAARLREATTARLEELAAALAKEAGAEGQAIPESDLKRRREDLATLRKEIEVRANEASEADRASHGQSERLAGQLGTLPEEIGVLQNQVRDLNGSIAELDRERGAAGRALDLLREVAADESSVLAELSEAVAETFARLSGVNGHPGHDISNPSTGTVAETQEAAVGLAGLRPGEIRAVDRQGTARVVEHLSNGARHLLYLALRLEMARRERRGGFALLCLDEPFAYLDPERQMETLIYLKGFLEETGWQLLLFTNDPAQAERVRAVFPDCKVHGLGEGGEV